MGERVLLTDERNAVLAGEYDGSDAALRNQKSRIRRSSETALRELTEVAESPYIDQTTLFDPQAVVELVRALVRPTWNHHYEEVEAGPGQHGSVKEKTDEFELYRSRLLLEMSKLVIEEPSPKADPDA